MRSFLKGKEYTLVFNIDDRQTYLFVESSYYLRTKAKAEREDAERNSIKLTSYSWLVIAACLFAYNLGRKINNRHNKGQEIILPFSFVM